MRHYGSFKQTIWAAFYHKKINHNRIFFSFQLHRGEAENRITCKTKKTSLYKLARKNYVKSTKRTVSRKQQKKYYEELNNETVKFDAFYNSAQKKLLFFKNRRDEVFKQKMKKKAKKLFKNF